MQSTDVNKGQSSMRFRLRFAASMVFLLLAAGELGCGRPFNVKTQPNMPPPSYAAKAVLESISVEAEAITDEDFLYDTFDANLISAGVLPVRVRLTNPGGEAVDLKSVRFEIEAVAGRFKTLSARQTFKRLISYYGISAYSKSGYAKSQESFVAFALDLATPLDGGQSRQGLVFFLGPSEAARRTGLTMIIGKRKSAETVSLKLN